MAIILASTISTERICLNPSEGRKVDGILAGDYSPGTIVVPILGVWTAADSDTAAHKLMHWGVVGYKKRVNQSTGALIDIDTAWDTSEVGEKRVPIWLSGFCIAKIDDLGANANVLTGVMIGANAGILKLQDNAQIDHGSLAANYVDDDTFCIVGIGAFNGLIWGGIN